MLNIITAPSPDFFFRALEVGQPVHFLSDGMKAIESFMWDILSEQLKVSVVFACVTRLWDSLKFPRCYYWLVTKHLQDF